jgi:chromosome segregation ATPase
LKGQIRELKIELETNRTSGTDGRSDRRKLEKELSKVKEQLEEELRDRARDVRQLDSYKKQVEMLKDRVDKVRTVMFSGSFFGDGLQL